MAGFSNELIFEYSSYVEYLDAALRGSKEKGGRKPRGSITAFARQLNCHTSFVAQVIAGKANLNHEQALVAADYFKLSEAERDHLVDLVMFERSGTLSAKKYFEEKLKARLASRERLASRLQFESKIPDAVSERFYSSWLNQVTYSLLHLSKFRTGVELHQALNVPSNTVSEVLELLIALGLVELKNNSYLPRERWMHLDPSSPAIRAHHQTWRLRTIEEITRQKELRGVHYSGAITVSSKSAKVIRERLLDFMEEVKREVSTSSSEVCHALCLDFYSLD